MNRMFPSLMLDSMHQMVDSATELGKAKLAAEHLDKLLVSIPMFKKMVLELFSEKLSRLIPGVEADQVFIARGTSTKNIEVRPVGSLTNVLFECLFQRISPNYVIGDDGVYDRPDTHAPEHQIAGLKIVDVETLIDNLRTKLDWEHVARLDQYWRAPVGVQSMSSTHKEILHQAMARMLMAELSLSVFAGRLDAAMAARMAQALSAPGAARYEVAVRDGKTLSGSFVLDSSGVASSEIPLGSDNYGYILYTSGRGFEYFANSIEMHTVLCERLSVTGNSITFPFLQQSAFDYGVDSALKQQRAEIKRLLGYDNGGVSGTALALALDRQQHLLSIQSGVMMNLESLRKDIQRMEWTGWLKEAPVQVQNKYVELEASMTRYDIDFKRSHGPYFSLRDYTREQVADWLNVALGIELDSDNIRVHTTYDINVGGKTIRQKDNRTLTEFVCYGVHDVGHALQISLEGAEGTGLTADNLERWMSGNNVRKGFVETRSVNPSAEYFQAFCNKIHSRLLFDLWVARHSGLFSQADFDLVSRAVSGDQSLFIKGVSYSQGIQPLRDVLVFQDLQHDDGPQQVYLRNPQGVFGFLRFNRFSDFRVQLLRWMIDDTAYASSLVHPDDWARVSLELRQRREQWAVGAVALDTTQNPLADAVKCDYRYALATAGRIAPPAFREVTPAVRQRHARLNTELKALYTVGLQETGFVSFEVFSRKLIKERVEQVLQSRGIHVQVDPDQVFVQTTEQTTYSLSELIFRQLSFEPPSSPHYDPRDYPRFYWSGAHPALDALSIRDIASWSKTLRAGEQYIDHLKQQYTPINRQYAFKQAVYFQRQLAEMAQAALSQFFDASLSVQQYKSLDRLITGLHTPEAQRLGDPVVKTESVYEFWLNANRRVDGVYLFRTVNSVGIEDFIYTPDAPDGLAFRSADDFAWSIRDRYRGLRNYYIERVRFVEKKSVNGLFDKIFATTDPVVVAPQIGARVRDLRVAYAAHVDKVIHDVDEQTTSLGEIIGKLIYDNVKLALAVISIVVPPAGLVLTAVETAKNIYDGLYALRYEDNEKAFTHLKDALIGLATLGKAAAGTASVTSAQKTLIDLFGDANTLVELVGQATGQTLGKDRLLEIIQQVLDEKIAGSSQTIIV
ncbi:hypothetical protein GIW70_14740 [Pseudomonas syringae]|nr:hypothetical protein [Pseudomonas syringae]MCF5069445.1 hypothetical protein [Pseudomonas syringae]